MANHGVETTFVPPLPSGLIDPNDILRAIRPQTRLISVMLANNETGVVQPVSRSAKCRRTGVFFHIDAVQGAGKIQFDVRKYRLPPAFHQRPQDVRPQGRGRDVRARGTPVESLWSVEATSAAAAPEPKM